MLTGLVEVSGQTFAPVGPGPLPSTNQVGRVIVVEDARATHTFNTVYPIVETMVRQGIGHLTGRHDPDLAWLQLVSVTDTIGIKVHAAPGAIIGTRPDVVRAVVKGLLSAGIAPERIIIWDRDRTDLRMAGFFEVAERLGVRIESATGHDFDLDTSYDSALPGSLVYGDVEFGQKGQGIGRRSYVSKLVSKVITRHIVIAPLLNHNIAGTTGCLYGMTMGAVDNKIRFERSPRALSEAVPEIMAMPVFFDRLALVISDALICQYQGESKNLLHYSRVLNQLRFSKDPVAIDVVALGELEAQRVKAGITDYKFPRWIYDNAALLQLGESNPRKIRFEWVERPAGQP